MMADRLGDVLAIGDPDEALAVCSSWARTYRSLLSTALGQLHDERREVARLKRLLADFLTDAREQRALTQVSRRSRSENTTTRPMQAGSSSSAKRLREASASYAPSASRASASRTSTGVHHAGALGM
jgi:hypothetical protein